jgi:pimeloyl-ACP methyl ester carboxylesterase
MNHMNRRTLIGAASSSRICVNGVELAYDDEGSGPTLLCLHAIGHGAGDYAALRARLKHRYRVIALDWPGQGASASESEPPGDERYSQHLEAFVDALGLDQITLLGNSVGGAASIRFASRRPEKVRALILANAAGLYLPIPGVRLFIRLMARVFAAGAAGASWFPRFFAWYYSRLLRYDAAAEQRARIIAAHRELAPLLALAWRGFAEPSADVRHLAETVSCPVLVAWAVLDPLNGLWLNRGGIRRFSNLRLATFRSGHSPFLELPEEFLVTFNEFMQSVDRRTLATLQLNPASRAEVSSASSADDRT